MSHANLCSLRRALVLGALVLFSATAVMAQGQYPNKPIRIIVPFAPGGTNDIMARLMAPYISSALNTPVFVENKAGAAGNIGIEAAAKSTPDGYTLLFSATASTQNPALFKALRFDPIKDIQPVAEIGRAPYLIWINPKMPVRTAAALVDYAKKNPGKLNASAGGIGSRLSVELFKIKNDIDLQIIPYSGTGPAAQAVFTGEVDFAICDASSMMGFFASNSVVPLMVASNKRMPSLPNVPHSVEVGMGGYQSGTNAGVYVAAGTPAAIVQKLNATINNITAMPEVAEKLRKLGTEPSAFTVDEFTQWYRREIEVWKDIVVRAKIPSVD
jgi:tripartite-type tricarboxylate transporter receptor subunit TctC